jgi:phospholipase/lecithinase/hemolysin
MIKSTVLTLALATASLAAPSTTNGTSWPGWTNIKRLFVFGDSYTQTGFNPASSQPNPSNPFGNPPYPGWTSSNGPNWLGFLTTLYNRSTILTYNFASGGATLDSALVAPYAPTVISVKDQIRTQFLPLYGSSPSTAPWTSNSSLFAFFIGINDVGNGWYQPNSSTLYTAIFSTYATLLDQIYATGARNFLFLNVPPVNLSPLITNQNDGGYATEYEGRVIVDWNERLRDMIGVFEKEHADVKIFLHDTNALFKNVLSHPGTLQQTVGLRNVTGYCKAYAK